MSNTFKAASAILKASLDDSQTRCLFRHYSTKISTFTTTSIAKKKIKIDIKHISNVIFYQKKFHCFKSYLEADQKEIATRRL